MTGYKTFNNNDLYNKGRCPNCGAEIPLYVSYDWKYGSPVRTCRKCKKKYIDKRYHEIEIDGYSPDSMNLTKDKMAVIIGIVIAVICSSIHIYEVTRLTYYYPVCAIMAMIGVILFFIGIIDLVMIKTGKKEKRLAKLREQSVRRMSDRSYAHQLLDAGYNVPDKYL